MDIKKLDCEVISKIRSSFSISNVAQCVFELVSNSLDAKATAVAVRINLVTFKIQVADNGLGITKENMELLGVRYTTNKCRVLKDLEKNLKTYGFKGEAIASIVAMCQSVTISSRLKTSSQTYQKALSKNCKDHVKLTKHRPSPGTTVTVFGWLSTAPVRQRRIVQDIELADVKNQLESLIIINPEISFTLRNEVTGLLILNSPKFPDIVGSFHHLHPEISDAFSLLKVSKSKISIEMLIQKELSLSKGFQYVYVNKRPIRSGRIFKHVYKAFSRKNNVRGTNPLYYNTKRYPVYVMNIKCPQSCVDTLRGSLNAEVEFTCWSLVLACIDKVIKTFFGLGEDRDKVMPVQGKLEEKISSGISQLCGAVQASAFKRKSDETTKSDDEIINPEHIASKMRRLKGQTPPREVTENQDRRTRVFVKDKTTLKPSQTSGNYQIEDSGDRQQPANMPLKIKSIIKKKPLGIKVSSKIFEQGSKMHIDPGFGQENQLNDDVNVKLFANKKQLVQQSQFDQRSVYSRLNTNENQGKDLIMDMFIKSTQVYKGVDDDIFDIPNPDVSKETIEESNILIENNVQDTVKGYNTTMSISVNVKKRKLKNIDNRASKCVQTSIFGDKLTSKCVQTTLNPEPTRPDNRWGDFQRHIMFNQKPAPVIQNLITNQDVGKKMPPKGLEITQKQLFQKESNQAGVPISVFGGHKEDLATKYCQTNPIHGWSRQKSYQTDLAARLGVFSLGDGNNNEDMKDDYTILINTIHKKSKYKFVRKSEDMEVDDNGGEIEFKPLNICNCDKENGNMFKFRENEPATEKSDVQLQALTLFRNSDGTINENHDARQKISNEFRKPMNPISKLKTATFNKNNKPSISLKDNVLFRGITKHPPPNTVNRPSCSESPYFFKNGNTRLKANVAQTLDKSTFDNFQPNFKSTQLSKNNFQGTYKHINDVFSSYPNPGKDVGSSFLTKNSLENINYNNIQQTEECQLPNKAYHTFYPKQKYPNLALNNQHCYENECNYRNEHPNRNHNFHNSNHISKACCKFPSSNKNQQNYFLPYPNAANLNIIPKNNNPQWEAENMYTENNALDTNIIQHPNIRPTIRGLEKRKTEICNVAQLDQFQPKGICKQSEVEQQQLMISENCRNFHNNKLYPDTHRQKLCSRDTNLQHNCYPNHPYPPYSKYSPLQPEIDAGLQKEGILPRNGNTQYGCYQNYCLHPEKDIGLQKEAILPRNQHKQYGCNQNSPETANQKPNFLFRNQKYMHSPLSKFQLQHQTNDDKTQTIDLSDPPWYTPVVSDENLYFEPGDERANVDIVNAEGETHEDNIFNFKQSCSPNIFSSELVNKALDGNNRIEDVDNNIKLNEPKSKTLDEGYKTDLNTICDFGSVNSPELLPKKQSHEVISNLEITIPNEEEQNKFVEQELLEVQINNNKKHSFSCESMSEVDVVEGQSVFDKGLLDIREHDINVVNNDRKNENCDERSRIIVDSQNEWLRQVNENGKKFFVNKRTGMVTGKIPNVSQINFDFGERLDFVPKGMSPVLKEHKKIDKTLTQNAKHRLQDLILEGYDDELITIKWQNFIGIDPKIFFETVYKEKSKQFDTCIPSIQDNNVKMSKDCISFSHNMFRSLDIIGQVDKKFIAVHEKTKNLLILFDQHAVHERIRVEIFLKEYKGIKTPCKEKLTIFVPHDDLSLLKKHIEYIESLGLGVKFFTNGLHITDIPLCVQEKFNAKVNFEELNKILNMLVKDIVEFLKSSRGSTINPMPQIIQNIINLKACRGSIKFGDTLLPQDCKRLLSDLSKCNLPFQCAHGRPTLVPILTLSKVQRMTKMNKLALKKLLLPKTY